MLKADTKPEDLPAYLQGTLRSKLAERSLAGLASGDGLFHACVSKSGLDECGTESEGWPRPLRWLPV